MKVSDTPPQLNLNQDDVCFPLAGRPYLYYIFSNILMNFFHLFQLRFPFCLVAYAGFLLQDERCLPPSDGAQELETSAEVGKGGVHFMFSSC